MQGSGVGKKRDQKAESKFQPLQTSVHKESEHKIAFETTEIEKLEAFEKSKKQNAAMRKFFNAGWGKLAAKCEGDQTSVESQADKLEQKERRVDVVRL